ncbi:MAG: molybdopterin-guanine dinucleotide biosynthesis protein MobB [Pseudomonadota bacterium]
MNIISIVSHSGSGKTTMIEKLARELTLRGLRVATIKHAHHTAQLDFITLAPESNCFRGDH